MASGFNFSSTNVNQHVFGNVGTTSSGTSFGGFGTGFGTSSNPVSTGFSFGQTTQQSRFVFGTPATTTSSKLGFAFGVPASSGISTFNFASTTTGSTGFSFGATSTAPAFGDVVISPAAVFDKLNRLSPTGAEDPDQIPPRIAMGEGFGGFGTASSAFGGTGGSGFGANKAPLFGTSNAPPFNFGQQQSTAAQPAQLQQQNALVSLAMALSMPQIHGDERDAIIARWNQVQASYGSGIGYFTQAGAFVEFKSDDAFCRFKAVGYSIIPRGRNEDGLVSLVIRKTQEEVVGAQEQFVATLAKIINRPNITVCVEGTRPVPEDRAEVVVYVLERPAQGPARRVAARELEAFLQQQLQWSQVQSQLAVVMMVAKIGWSEEQVRDYLARPPAGIDPLIWRQARLDNPDPDRFIPVTMVGFHELERRRQRQEEETKLHQQRLDVMMTDMQNLQSQHSQTMVQLDDFKRKHLELCNRLLKVIVKQEVGRKLGLAIQPQEEELKVRLEHLQTELDRPAQFKGRMDSLLSLANVRPNQAAYWCGDEFTFHNDTGQLSEVRQILKQQQEGLQHLISIIKDDNRELKLMEEAMTASRIPVH